MIPHNKATTTDVFPPSHLASAARTKESPLKTFPTQKLKLQFRAIQMHTMKLIATFLRFHILRKTARLYNFILKFALFLIGLIISKILVYTIIKIKSSQVIWHIFGCFFGTKSDNNYIFFRNRAMVNFAIMTGLLVWSALFITIQLPWWSSMSV